ncbi:MAG: glycosyltransferase [Solirubrobacteraceae bacterium]
MSRLLAYTSPARGHLYPVVPMLTELDRRGHRTVAYGLSSELEHLQALGIDARAIAPIIEENQIVDWRERLPPLAAASVLRTFAQRSEREAPDLHCAIEVHNPDALLIDVNCWGAAAVAEASGLPWAVYSPYLLPLRSRDVPPFGMGLRPLRGPLGRVRDAVAAKAVDAVFERAAMGSLGDLRRGYGLSEIHSFDELLRGAPLLLSLTAEGFEYPRTDWPSSVRLVGPMNWSPPQPAPAWLAELSDPLALVTCSTERQRDKRLLHVAMEGLPAAGISVIGTSAAHDPEAFSSPAGSKVVRFASHDPLLRRAVCVVCHGGLGITQKALAAGVPVVVVPFGRDQMETARRVELAQAGVRLSPRRLTPSRLLKAVEAAIELRPGAERVRQAFAAAGGATAAADALETLLRPAERSHEFSRHNL